MNIFLTLIGALLIIAGIALTIIMVIYRRRAAYHHGYSDAGVKKAVKVPLWTCLIVAAGFLLLVLSQSFAIVPTGYTGVRTTFGLIDQESCMPGFNALVPFVQNISLVNNKQQDLRFEDKVWSETSEQTVVYMENVVVTYNIVPESSAWIYANVENWIEEVLDQDIVNSSLKAASRRLPDDKVTDRAVIEPLAVKSLQAAVDEKYGKGRVNIKNVIINNMDFDESYNAAIAKKSVATQEQQEQAIRNQTAIDQATAEAEAARVAAQGQADAELIIAQGKAKANETIANSITDATQRQDAIEKWNGELPRYMGGEDGSFGILETIEPQPAS